MDALIRSRDSSKGWVTREKNQLHSYVHSRTLPTCTYEGLKVKISEFDKRLDALDKAQTKVELEIADDKQLEIEIDTASEFRAKAIETKMEAMAKLADLKSSTVLLPKSDKDGGHSAVRAKLPKLEIAKFDGDILKWQTFWDQFVAIVHSSDTAVITKFTYLKSLLEGDALESVRGLTLTEANYATACNCLKERFGRKERIIFGHIQALLGMPVPNNLSVPNLWRFRDDLNIHVRSLENLGVGGDTYGLFLTPLILSKLPKEVRMEWARDGEGKERDLPYLLQFLKSEIERRERCDGFKQKESTSKHGKDTHSKDALNPNSNPNMRPSTVSAMSATATSYEPCAFCAKNHPSNKCFQVTRATFEERRNKFREIGVCFRCLAKNHIARGCKARCSKCSGKHHELLCDPNFKAKRDSKAKSESRSKSDSKESLSGVNESIEEQKTVTPSHCGVTHTGGQRVHTVLQTARVLVSGQKCDIQATIMFDTGSDNTYISSDLVRKIRPKWVSARSMSYAAFGEGKPSQNSVHNVYQVELRTKSEKQEVLHAVEVKTICAPMHRPRVPIQVLQSLGHLDLADSYDESQDITIDILVGLDRYWDFMTGDTLRLSDAGLVVQDTAFGWVLSGLWKEDNGSASLNAVVPGASLVCLSDLPPATLENFWDLELIGISPSQEAQLAEDGVLRDFNENIRFIGGRYEVRLPWKPDMKHQLLDNKVQAEIRLTSLNRKLSKDPVLQKGYNEALSTLENLGIISEVTPSANDSTPKPVYYMPHHPVVKHSSLTTKIRPVFDASSKAVNRLSLNDCLESGPSLLPDLVSILIRFRRWKVGLTADITKAFLQIKVHEDDQDVHRFLWTVDGRTREMKFLRVPFGNTSSPFLLNATILHHLSQYPDSVAVCELRDNLYVDDYLSGADDHEAGVQLFYESNRIMSEANLQFASWNSNDESVTEMFFKEFGSKQLNKESVKILGLKWLKQSDQFAFGGLDVQNDLVVTKRVVLSCLARLYDPLGFLTPFITFLKILLQEIWLKKTDWDEEVPLELRNKFLRWVSGIRSIQEMRIPRCYMTTSPLSWSCIEDLPGLELNCFGDASEKGYGAAVYLRIPKGDDTFDVSLVISRARVAPVKRISLPRLELLGSLLVARLMVFVRGALKMPDIAYRCWTDSTVALAWIKGDPARWKQFVGNRVREIQRLTSTSLWAHCPGKENPADLMTRGVLADELIRSQKWLNGPKWLSGTIADTTVDEVASFQMVEQYLQNEMKPVPEESVMVVASNWLPLEQVLLAQKWDRLSDAVRNAAWVYRFIHNLKNRDSRCLDPQLSREELANAKMRMVQHVQETNFAKELAALRKKKSVPESLRLFALTPFIDTEGLLRVGGRLEQSGLSYGEKHPLIIPKGQLAILLIRAEHLKLKHAGVNAIITSLRDEYWIMDLRRLAKSVKKSCIACQRVDAKPCNQVAAPLPGIRVHQAPPFTVTGLDYAGPLLCLDLPDRKLYILLFTCAVIRAVRLELTESLSVPDCILALRRFSARRGLPSVICSDHAKTFESTEKELVKFFGANCPKWQYIAPRSPWWGGWWERLVRSVKNALRKSLGSRCITKTELVTNLQEIEACINSRPLTFVGDDVLSPKPLTPSHFLIGRTAGFQSRIVDGEVQISQEDLSEHELIRQRQLELFWEIWTKDYIRNLPTSVPRFRPKGKVGVGSLVLIREDGIPRMRWPLGLVTKEFPGKDGLTRSVELKTSRGPLVRSIQRLHDLELCSQPSVQEQSVLNGAQLTTDEKPQSPVLTHKATRCGRVIKPKQRLDL